MFALPVADAIAAHHRSPKENTMNTSLKIKLVAVFTTVAMFALPAADALAHTGW